MGLFGPKGVNLSRLLGLVQSQYNGITFEQKELTADKAVITANIVAEKYFDDGIFVRIVAYKSGTCHVFLVFDELDPTFENLKLINEYNDHSSFLSAYISQKDGGKFLELHGSSMDAPDEKVLSETIAYFINEALNEKLLKYLQPLTNRTYTAPSNTKVGY